MERKGMDSPPPLGLTEFFSRILHQGGEGVVILCYNLLAVI